MGVLGVGMVPEGVGGGPEGIWRGGPGGYLGGAKLVESILGVCPPAGGFLGGIFRGGGWGPGGGISGLLGGPLTLS